ncbi:MAG: ribosomal RNA small subunit methyltransferase I [Pseudomonadota bacterium]
MPLFVAATPLGNLQDASPRLIAALGAADLIFAEDTRQARKLCSALGVATPRALSSHAHNEHQRVEAGLAALREGRTVLLLSDAGTPCISDPGQPLVAAAHAEGLPVFGLPGPSAPAVALSVSGLPAAPSCFLGFPPRKAGERERLLREALGWGMTLVLFEAPGRTARLVAELAALAPGREACLCRELTKLHEENLRRPLPALAAELAERELRGEVTLVVGPGEPPAAPDVAPVEGQAGAAEALAKAWGVPRRDVYAALSKLKERLR